MQNCKNWILAYLCLLSQSFWKKLYCAPIPNSQIEYWFISYTISFIFYYNSKKKVFEACKSFSINDILMFWLLFIHNLFVAYPTQLLSKFVTILKHYTLIIFSELDFCSSCDCAQKKYFWSSRSYPRWISTGNGSSKGGDWTASAITTSRLTPGEMGPCGGILNRLNDATRNMCEKTFHRRVVEPIGILRITMKMLLQTSRKLLQWERNFQICQQKVVERLHLLVKPFSNYLTIRLHRFIQYNQD